MTDRSVGLLSAGLLAVLLAVAPRPGSALELLGGPLDPADPTGPLLAVLSLITWALAGWLCLGAALVATGRLPGTIGRLAAVLAGWALPAAVRRSLEISLGASLVVGTIGATPAVAATVDEGQPVTSSRVLPGSAALSLDWPVSRTGAAPALSGVSQTAAPFPTPAPAPPAPSAPVAPDPVASTPAPSTPVVSATGAPGAGSPVDLPPAPAAPSPVATASAWRAPVSPAAVERTGRAATDPTAVGPAAAGTVVVQPGDTLWAVAARELAADGVTASDAHVAVRWPAWWAANRTAIGDDPNLLRPGTALAPPLR